MSIFTKLIGLMALLNLTGCAFSNIFKYDASNDQFAHQSNLQTFRIEGTLIHYRDLSDPCDNTSVAWDKSTDVDPIKNVSLESNNIECSNANAVQQVATNEFEVQKQFNIPFASRQAKFSGNASDNKFEAITEFVSANTRFHVYGAAGTVGPKSEKLGLARASTVRDHLVSMGVQQERITIMPYDPQIPGLQAVIKVLGPAML